MTAGLVRTVIQIYGIRDNLCRERIMEILGRVEGVQDVNVSLIRALAIVLHDSSCERETLIETVRKAGYVAKLIAKD